MLTGRLAPSPTGRLHLGHARSFLLAWWSIRAKGGRLVLRLEDLDGERSSDAFVDLAKTDLEWLGLDWDDAPRVQSQGLERLREAAESLAKHGQAYPCVCTRGDLRAIVQAPQQGASELRYSGRCRDRFADLAEAERRSGRPSALRFRAPEGPVTVYDEFSGAHTFDVQAEVGDFPILRRDKIPSYQLSVVVDDDFDGVTEVVRGDDLLPSAARQILLAQSLGIVSPKYYHVPLVVDASGRRLAKRCDDLGISTLREAGVDPRAVVGWVAHSSGIGARLRMTAREALEAFEWQRVPSTPVVFDEPTQAWLLSAR